MSDIHIHIHGEGVESAATSSPSPTRSKKSSRKTSSPTRSTPKKVAKKMPANGYHAKYGRAFKRLSPKYKLKNGSWKKNGFKLCAAAARRVAKK